MSHSLSEPEWSAFLRHIGSLPRDEVERQNREHHEEAVRLHARFKECFPKGVCDCCGKPLLTFSRGVPCFHWLLRPKGVKKDDLEALFHAKGYFRIASYVRWIANEDAYLSRINDLKGEGHAGAVFHWSATYKHIKWTFWCTQGDYEGHSGSKADFPHFHVEVRLNGQVFVRFSDFHVPFTPEDLFYLKCNSDPRAPIEQSFGAYGAGMEDAVSIPLEKILDDTTSTDDETKAVYRIQTIMMAEEGKAISGDLIDEIVKKSKATGKPMAHFIKESGLNAQIIVSPNDAVPEKETRSNPRGKQGTE